MLSNVHSPNPPDSDHVFVVHRSDASFEQLKFRGCAKAVVSTTLGPSLPGLIRGNDDSPTNRTVTIKFRYVDFVRNGGYERDASVSAIRAGATSHVIAVNCRLSGDETFIQDFLSAIEVASLHRS